MRKKIFQKIISGFFSFLIFLIILGLANLGSKILSIEVFSEIIKIFNSNILLIAIIGATGIFSSILWISPIYFRLFSPILDGIIGIFIFFIFSEMFELLLKYSFVEFKIPFFLISVFIFFLVLLIGYTRIYFSEKKRFKK